MLEDCYHSLTKLNSITFLEMKNKMEDALATLASMYQVNTWNDIPRITVWRLYRPAHVFTTEEVADEKPWYYDIKHFIQTQEYPIDASKKDRKH